MSKLGSGGPGTSTVEGPEGADLATEETAAEQLARTPALDTPEDEEDDKPGVPTTAYQMGWAPAVGPGKWVRAQWSEDPGQVLGPKFGQHVHVLGGVITTTPAQQFLLTSPPAASEPATATRIVGTNQTPEAGALCTVPPLGWAGSSTPAEDARGQHVRLAGTRSAGLTSMSGAARVAPYRSLSYVQHDPGQMVSLGGTVAYNPRCDFNAAGSGSFTYIPERRAVRLAVTSASGDRMTYRQRMWNPAVPGAIQHVTFSVLFDVPRAGQETDAGAFDDLDGVFVRQTVAGVFLVVRSSVSGAAVEATPVPIPGLDPTTDRIVEIRYLWPAGGVEVWADGVRLLFVPKNGGSAPWMRRPNLPFTAQIRNTGASSSGFVDVIWFDVHSEGADKLNRSPATLTLTATDIGTGGKLLFQARAKSTFDLGTILAIPNRNVYIPRHVHVETTDGPMVVRCYANGTTSGTPSWAASAEQGIEVDNAAVFAGATGINFANTTIDNTTGTGEIHFQDPDIHAFPTTSGAYFGPEVLQIVGFARTGSVNEATVHVEIERIW